MCLYICAALFMKSCLLSDGVLVQFRFGSIGEHTWSGRDGQVSNGVHVYDADVLYSLSRPVEPEHVDWEFYANTRTMTH